MTAEQLISNWKCAQLSGAMLPCPRCGQMKMKAQVSEDKISRIGNAHICRNCYLSENSEERTLIRTPSVSKDSFLNKWWIVSEALGSVEPKQSSVDEYELVVKRRCYLTKQDVDDIVAIALEGGINYWCYKAEVVEKEYLGEFASEQISRGGSLRLYDSEEDASYILTLDKLLTGFVLACRNGYGRIWFGEDDYVECANIDADAADTIIQFALFGEIMYA